MLSVYLEFSPAIWFRTVLPHIVTIGRHLLLGPLSLSCSDSLFPASGFGIKKVSVVNMKASQYVPIHSKQIRGLSFNRQNDSLLLSAALDNTVKLTRYTSACAYECENLCVCSFTCGILSTKMLILLAK